MIYEFYQIVINLAYRNLLGYNSLSNHFPGLVDHIPV